MSPIQPMADKWVRLHEAFHSALDLPQGVERQEFLSQALADAPEWLEEAQAMLVAHEREHALDIENRLLAEDEQPNLSGKTIGPYQLLSLIGRGGMGEVYVARRQDPNLPQLVALKLLTAGWYSKEALSRFRREQQILTRLDHPNIASLLDGGVSEEGCPYLVLQYVQGQAITEYCREKRLPVRERLRIFCAVARAVEHAHRNLVVHRDLKPSNILVTAEGQVRLLDFGIAKLLDRQAEPGFPRTRTGLRVMTPEYAAPEQIRGGEVTAATDVHGLGALLYELVAGCRPHGGQNLEAGELERRILEKDPVAPSRLVPREEARTLRGDLDAIAGKALRKEPQERFSSAADMADDIERYLAGRTVRARPSSTRYRLTKFVRRNRIASALALLSAALLVTFAVTASYQARSIERERDLTRSEQEKADDVAAVLTDLYAMSNPGQPLRPEEPSFTESLRQAEEMVSDQDGLEPLVRARLRHVLGRVHHKKRQYNQARTHLEASLAGFRAAKGDGDPSTKAVLEDLQRLSAKTEAPHPEPKQSSGKKKEEARPAEPVQTAAMHHALMDLRTKNQGNESADVAFSFNKLALSLTLSAQYADAEMAYREAYRRFHRLHGSMSPHVSEAARNVGRLLQMQGRFQESLAAFDEALHIARQTTNNDSVPALMEAQRAVVVNRLGRRKEALAILQSAVSRLREFRADRPHALAEAQMFLGFTLLEEGEFEKAGSLFREAMEIRQLFPAGHPRRAEAECALAMSLALAGNASQANELFARSFHIYGRWGIADPVELSRMRKLFPEPDSRQLP